MTATLQGEALAARVGFVVIGRNEGARLVRCLESLIAQGASAIVYVDSGSIDASVEEAENRKARVVRLDLSRPFTAGRARNEGFALLQKTLPRLQYVQFVDGDCELAPRWLDAALSFMERRPDVAVVCGRRRERDPEASIYNRLCDIEWNTPVGEAIACGGDSLVRAAAFAEVGGFDSRLIAGEEPEFCHRLRATGARIWRLDETMTFHDAAIYRLSQWWMRAIRSGFGYAQVWASTRGGTMPLYQTELRRAAFWAGILPLSILFASAIYPLAGLALLGIYCLQVVRIAYRRGLTRAESWAFAFFAVLAKFPELLGAMRYSIRVRRKGASHAILYK